MSKIKSAYAALLFLFRLERTTEALRKAISDGLEGSQRNALDIYNHISTLEGTVRGLSDTVRSLSDTVRSLSDTVRTLVDQAPSVTKSVDSLQTKTEEHRLAIANRVTRLESLLELGIPWLSDDSSLADDPEFLLMAYLYAVLPSRVAIDVGANEGRLSRLLLETGYRVFAFEPYPPILEKLRENLGGNPEMTIFNCALGSQNTKLPLHIATVEKNKLIGDGSLYNTFKPHFLSEGVAYKSEIEVIVRTLSSLIDEGAVPKEVSLLKIDTEGYDLEVIRGMGNLHPAVVEAEFWGDEFLFVRYEKENRPVSSGAIISEMRSRGYWWNLIIFRIEGEYAIHFTANLASAPKRAWGNIFFFEEFDVFSTAYRWCQAALPRLQDAANAQERDLINKVNDGKI